MRILAINAGRKGGGGSRLDAIIVNAFATDEKWDIIFCGELDGRLGELLASQWLTRGGHAVIRHWPGEGSVVQQQWASS